MIYRVHYAIILLYLSSLFFLLLHTISYHKFPTHLSKKKISSVFLFFSHFQLSSHLFNYFFHFLRNNKRSGRHQHYFGRTDNYDAGVILQRLSNFLKVLLDSYVYYILSKSCTIIFFIND